MKVEEQVPAPLDEEFAKGFGIADGSIETLRAEVRANMERELNEAIRQKLRAQVLEGLFTKNPLELPRQLVEEQIQELQVEMLRRAGVKDAKQLPPREPFEQPARRRVALEPAHERAGAQRQSQGEPRSRAGKVERTGGVLFKP